MIKSNKRIKLEREIFSTSIRDIEQMFSSALSEVEENDIRPRKVSSCGSSWQNGSTFPPNLNFKASKSYSSKSHPFDLSAFYLPNLGPLRYEMGSSNSGHNGIQLKQNHIRLDLPVGTCLGESKFEYDCINMSLLSDAQSECNSTSYLGPSSNHLTHARTSAKDYVVVSQNVLFNMNEELLDDYMFELDLKLYSPRVNLESDLKMIDVLITRPMSIAN